MPTFNNLSELKKYVESNRGQSGLLDEKQVARILTDAGRTLETYLKEELKSYFDSYTPTHPEYRRGLTVASIKVSQPEKRNDNEWSLEILFDPSIANHPSVFGEGQPDGYTPWLLHSGWKTKLDSTLNIENFTRFKGTNYITKAVNRFNSNNPYGLTVEVYRGNKDITGRTYSYGK